MMIGRPKTQRLRLAIIGGQLRGARAMPLSINRYRRIWHWEMQARALPGYVPGERVNAVVRHVTRGLNLPGGEWRL